MKPRKSALPKSWPRTPMHKGIRIGVKNAGCAGMEYTVDLVTEPNAADDKVVTASGTVLC